MLADLAPEQQRTRYDVGGSGATAMVWLGVSRDPSTETVPLDPSFAQQVGSVLLATGAGMGDHRSLPLPKDPGIERLERYDAMTPGLPSLAYGCLWAVGRATVDGEERRILRPLVSTPAHIRPGRRGFGSKRLLIDDEWSLWPLLMDHAEVAALECNPMPTSSRMGPRPTAAWLDVHGGVLDWVNAVLAASDLPPVRGVEAPTSPTRHAEGPLRVVVGWGLFTEGSADLLRPREALNAWSGDPEIGDTAFASMYLGPNATSGPAEPDDGVASTPPQPLGCSVPLSLAQERALRRAHHEPVVAISGPPGTGKSQTAVAIASDAVSRGESVLVATQSAMAADVLAELLDRASGPTPILFGGGRRATALAAKLADGIDAPAHAAARERWRQRQREHDDLRAAIEQDLGDLASAERWQALQLTAEVHRSRAPRFFDGRDAALAEALADGRRLAAAAAAEAQGWLAGRRRRRAEAQFRSLAGASRTTPLDDLVASLEVAEVRLRAGRAHQRDEALAERRWTALVAAEEDARQARGELVAAEVAERADADARRHVAALAAALRAGRARRRAHLMAVDVPALTTALPLWIGTLGEIESLLPPVAGEFDLVILDEASLIDQASASAALLRARRAVVIGDPRQLRFVSFLADAAVQDAIDANDCRHLADRLDLRRTSAFDLATSVSPVSFLDEHFRSVPHLIGFSAHRFYDDRLQVATRHPGNETRTAIEVVAVAGEREDGVNAAEVVAAVGQVRRLLADHEGPIGVISPHRPQVDALRTAVADSVGPEVWGAGRIRVATVHGFQGSECDAVVASFGLSGDGGTGRRFLEDPNLFNVLVTRARHEMVVLASVTDVRPGLLADYLRWAGTPPSRAPEAGAADAWTERLAALLVDHGVRVRCGYPVGAWTVDLVIGDDAEAVAVSTHVHPEGTFRHVQRHLALHRAGWRQVEAFPPADDGRAALVAMDLVARVRASRS